jgi:hypothetical protein
MGEWRQNPTYFQPSILVPQEVPGCEAGKQASDVQKTPTESKLSPHFYRGLVVIYSMPVNKSRRNTWKVLNYGAGEGWRRSVGPIMWEMKKLLRVNEQRNILHEIRKRKANWIGQILRRNCLLKQVMEGKIKGEMEVSRRRGRRRKELLDDLKDRRGYSHLKEEALYRTMWRNRFRAGFEHVVRQNTEWMNE